MSETPVTEDRIVTVRRAAGAGSVDLPGPNIRINEGDTWYMPEAEARGRPDWDIVEETAAEPAPLPIPVAEPVPVEPEPVTAEETTEIAPDSVPIADDAPAVRTRTSRG